MKHMAVIDFYVILLIWNVSADFISEWIFPYWIHSYFLALLSICYGELSLTAISIVERIRLTNLFVNEKCAYFMIIECWFFNESLSMAHLQRARRATVFCVPVLIVYKAQIVPAPELETDDFNRRLSKIYQKASFVRTHNFQYCNFLDLSCPQLLLSKQRQCIYIYIYICTNKFLSNCLGS